MRKRKNVQLTNDRVDTDLHMYPLSDGQAELMRRILEHPFLNDTKNWEFDPLKQYIEIKGVRIEIPLGIRMIKQIIVDQRLKIKITQKAYLLMELFTGASLEKIEFVLHRIGNYYERGESQRWFVNSDIFVYGIFPFGFPNKKDWEKWLKKQKKQVIIRNGQLYNRIDIFPEEWKIKTTKK